MTEAIRPRAPTSPAATSSRPSAPPPWPSVGPAGSAAGPSPSRPAETAVARFYDSLKGDQKAQICFPFDHPLRSQVHNNWAIVKPTIGDLNPEQQALCKEVFKNLCSDDGHDRFLRQMARTTAGSRATTSPSSASRGPTGPSNGSSPAATTPSAPTATASRRPSAARSSTATPRRASTRTPATPATSGGTRPSGPTRSSRPSTTRRRPGPSSPSGPSLGEIRPPRRRPRRPAEGDGPGPPEGPAPALPHLRRRGAPGVPSRPGGRQAPADLLRKATSTASGTSGSSKAPPSPGTSTARRTSTPGSTSAGLTTVPVQLRAARFCASRATNAACSGEATPWSMTCRTVVSRPRGAPRDRARGPGRPPSGKGRPGRERRGRATLDPTEPEEIVRVDARTTYSGTPARS